MASSGIYADSYTDERFCTEEDVNGNECDFTGEVEVYFDPEVQSEWWDCPLCKYPHLGPWEPYQDDDYPEVEDF